MTKRTDVWKLPRYSSVPDPEKPFKEFVNVILCMRDGDRTLSANAHRVFKAMSNSMEAGVVEVSAPAGQYIVPRYRLSGNTYAFPFIQLLDAGASAAAQDVVDNPSSFKGIKIAANERADAWVFDATDCYVSFVPGIELVLLPETTGVLNASSLTIGQTLD